MERMTESVRRELQAAGRPLGGSDVANPGYKRPTIPPADFSDPVLAYMSGRSLVNATRGNAPLDVGLNGSGVRDREGLGLIPRNIRSEMPPVEMTYADIVSAIAEDNKFSLAENGMGDPASVGVDELGKIGWNRFIGAHECVGQYGPASDGKVPYKLRNIDRRTLERLRSDPSATILVFDPALSPNGIDVDGTYGSIKSGGTIAMHQNDIVTISGIPAGTYYRVTELSTQGYHVSVNGNEGYIVSGNIETGEIKPAAFVNTPYYELPSTGGAGTGPYITGGLLLTAAASVLLLYNHIKRRKEDTAFS